MTRHADAQVHYAMNPKDYSLNTQVAGEQLKLPTTARPG